MFLTDFIADLVDSVAWPVCVGILAFIFRPQLRDLIGLIETVRFGGAELKLKDNVKGVAKKAELVGASWDAMTLKPPPTTIELDPGIAVIKAWASVETAIGHLVEENRDKLGPTPPRSTRRRIDMLLQANIIEDPLGGILRDMNATRDMIAHGQDLILHYETVKLYEETAAYVESIVEQLEESRSNPR